ncbi:hypothetical protein V8G54_010360 [Vigna mungo]|uniref:STAR protein homodimerisation region domain-containing protein n=1 Tax=Vigna mungo TaxID=3915 RepID=A0AAQ3NZW9_VIGMU
MSGLYNSNFSPVRAASPQIRTNPEVDRYSYSTSTLQLGCFNYASSESIQLNCFCFCFFFFSQYLTELLAEHQKLGPFMQALPICTRLLNQGFHFLELLLYVKCLVQTGMPISFLADYEPSVGFNPVIKQFPEEGLDSAIQAKALGPSTSVFTSKPGVVY